MSDHSAERPCEPTCFECTRLMIEARQQRVIDKATDSLTVERDSLRQQLAVKSAALAQCATRYRALATWAKQLVDNDGAGARYHAGLAIEARDGIRSIVYYDEPAKAGHAVRVENIGELFNQKRYDDERAEHERTKAELAAWRTEASLCRDTHDGFDEVQAQAATMRKAARCEFCDRPATCVGEYETCGERTSFACDNCCGHGNEDGKCTLLAEHDTKSQNLKAELAEAERNVQSLIKERNDYFERLHVVEQERDEAVAARHAAQYERKVVVEAARLGLKWAQGKTVSLQQADEYEQDLATIRAVVDPPK